MSTSGSTKPLKIVTAKSRAQNTQQAVLAERGITSSSIVQTILDTKEALRRFITPATAARHKGLVADFIRIIDECVVLAPEILHDCVGNPESASDFFKRGGLLFHAFN